jgi:autotransporter passenger strand-loop-strand repeat protein
MCFNGGIATASSAPEWERPDGAVIYRENVITGTVTWSNVTKKDVFVESAGKLTLASNGRTSNTTVQQGGQMFVTSGGSANTNSVLNDGKLFVSNGGKANYTTIQSGGYAYNRGGSMLGVTIKNGGRAYVSKGSVADTLYISQGGNAYVWSGGTAKNAYTQSFGCLYVYDGGVASSTKLMTNGNLYIYSGGKAFDTVTSFGVKIHMYGGSMNNLNMQRGTIVSAYKGAIVTNATVDYGSYLLLGGTANSCTGVASATNTNVLSGGGLTVITGAKATGITLAVNGTLTCNNGGTIGGMITNAGRMNLAGSAALASGTNINFNLSGKSASAMVESYKEAMLNSFYVARNANMSITVSADQSAGDYILANWAGSANGKSIALTVGSTAINDLSTDASIIYDGKKYSLYCFDDATNSKALTLKIENLSADSLMENPDTLPDLSLPELPEASGASELTAESLCFDCCAPTIAAAPTLDDLFAKTTTQLPLLAV